MSPARADLGFGVGWAVFGATVLVASWRMDRLDGLNINPWSAPGLMPGLLGALLLLFGIALAIRAFASAQVVPQGISARRALLALGLCLAFAAGLLGRGLPFWLTSSAFLFVSILAFRVLDRDAESPAPLARLAASSAAIALGAALFISLLFEKVFLVRLP